MEDETIKAAIQMTMETHKTACDICGYMKRPTSFKYMAQADKPDSKNECNDCIHYRNRFGIDPSHR